MRPTNHAITRESARAGRVAAVSVTAALTLSGAATALAADAPAPDDRLPVLERKGPLERSVEAHVARERYESAYSRAKDLRLAPGRNVARGRARVGNVRAEASELNREIARARAKRKARRKREAREAKAGTAVGDPGSVGVEQGTLEAIAACESGGDPTAVDASGTYRGKYQFDLGTWASVGGSGDPAAAPEAEQDYRAALLLSQSGSSPWPVCG